jgi:L-threonylcarbamoyladenylate synthase
MTRLLKVDRDAPEPGTLEEAARCLRSGGLVAFATETVYGLGADATDPEAVGRIFEAKGRPAANPLIVHGDGLAMIRSCVSSWPDQAQVLAERFWPGPLTIVLPRSRWIPDIVTAGGETVGVRIPATRIARGLIERLQVPIAAPSANRSTGLSPTRADHVRTDLEGKVDLILDSGPTDIGLESTVLDLTGHVPRILRPGLLTAEELNEALGGTGPVAVHSAEGPTGRSPGEFPRHYEPRTPALRIEAERLRFLDWDPRTALLVVGHRGIPTFTGPTLRLDLADPKTAAAELYATLHDWDGRGLARIVVVPPPDEPAWVAIRDRLWRATRPIPED